MCNAMGDLLDICIASNWILSISHTVANQIWPEYRCPAELELLYLHKSQRENQVLGIYK